MNMASKVSKQLLNPDNSASFSLMMAIDQPAILFSRKQHVIAINDKARITMGLVRKSVKNNTMREIIQKSGYSLKAKNQEALFTHGKSLIIDNHDHPNAQPIEYKCIETIDAKNRTTGFLLLGKVLSNNTSLVVKADGKSKQDDFDAVPCGIFVKDITGRVIDSNVTMATMLGFNTKQELVDVDTYQLAVDGWECVKRNDLRVMKSKKTMNFEEEVTLQNGLKRCYYTIKAPLFNEKNQVVGIIGVSFDHTKKKNKEQILMKQLKASKKESIQSFNYLDRIIASIPCSVWWTDMKNVVLGGNDRVVQFLGLKSRSELIGLTYAEVGKRKNISHILNKSYEDDMEVMRTGIPKENIPEPPLPMPNGEKIYYVTTRTPLYDEHGKISGMIGTSWDITNRVKVENKLKAAQKKLEASNKAKDEFLATVSHELRTPLNGILGMADILARQKLAIRQKALVTDLIKSGEILLSLIDDLLDITKFELHEIKINNTGVNLKKLIQEVSSHLSAQLKQKKIEFSSKYSSELPLMIHGDPQRLKQILFNIIGNAIKFTEEGQISIEVMPKNTTHIQKQLELHIRDTGIGIPNNKLNRIFDRFTQVRSVQTKHITGTGLGLSISKGLVELMGGRITVTSQLGVGSHFTITLPYEKWIDTSLTSDITVDISTARILIVDDDLGAVDELLKYLQKNQVQLVSSACAIDILNSASKQKSQFNIIMISAKNTEAPIESLVKQIHENFSQPQPIIMFYAESISNQLRHIAKDLGVNLLLTIPTKKNQLIKVLQKAWKQYLILNTNSHHSIMAMGLKVLLVEDNQINQKVANHFLSELNCKVDTSPTGNEAIDYYSKNNYDVVLMDIGLPDISGIEVTKKLRKLQLHSREIPIIAMTAYASENDRARFLASGMDDVITKPVDFESLKSVIAKWLSLS